MVFRVSIHDDAVLFVMYNTCRLFLALQTNEVPAATLKCARQLTMCFWFPLPGPTLIRSPIGSDLLSPFPQTVRMRGNFYTRLFLRARTIEAFFSWRGRIEGSGRSAEGDSRACWLGRRASPSERWSLVGPTLEGYSPHLSRGGGGRIRDTDSKRGFCTALLPYY